MVIFYWSFHTLEPRQDLSLCCSPNVVLSGCQWIELHQVEDPHQVYHFFIFLNFCFKGRWQRPSALLWTCSVPVFNSFNHSWLGTRYNVEIELQWQQECFSLDEKLTLNWLVICKQGKRVPKQIYTKLLDPHTIEKASFSICVYFCSLFVSVLEVKVMGMHHKQAIVIGLDHSG